MRWRALLLGCLLGGALAAVAAPGVPIAFTLDAPSTVTLVLEDANGVRVRNLLSATRLPAGKHVVQWDGYDEGTAETDTLTDGVTLTHHRAPAGQYRVRGLVHDGLHLRYEFSVYSPGTPPWPTRDGAGGWLGDHAAPSGLVFLPQGASPYGKGQPQVLAGTICAEMGHAAMFLDLTGRKLFGSDVGYGSWGPKVVARDVGPAPLADYIAYGVVYDRLVGFFRAGGVQAICTWDNQGFKTLFQEGRDASLAVYNGLAVISTRLDERLTFIDLAKKATIGTLKLASPRGVAFDAAGRLFVATGTRVQSYAVVPGAAELRDARTVIADGLDDPCQLLLDGAGHLYVSDWGASHQVKVFTLDGKQLRAIGKAGGPQVGTYDAARMASPYGLALDAQGVLWVAESEYAPKRISRWDAATGRFLNAFYGGPKYAAGGVLNPRDPTRFRYDDQYVNGVSGLEFRLDWAAGTATLDNIYYRGPRLKFEKTLCDFEALYRAPFGDYARTWYPGELPAGTHAPERPVSCADRTYLVNDEAIWLVGADGQIKQVAAFCLMNQFFQPGIGWSKHVDPAHLAAVQAHLLQVTNGAKDGMLRYLCAWSDADLNGVVDPDEVQVTRVWPHPLPPVEHLAVADDLSVTLRCGGGLPAPAINALGVPVYDLAKLTWAIDAAHPEAKAAGHLPAGDGWLCGFRAGFQRGVCKWTWRTLPNRYLAQQPGDIVQPMRVLGPAVTPRQGDAGTFFAFNNYWGSIYLMTADGLLLDTLGGDCRITPYLRLPEAKRGMHLDGVTFESEHFYPTMTQVRDGAIYLVVGKDHSSIVRLEGLEAVQRRTFGTLTLTPEQIAERPETWTERLGGQSRKTMIASLVRQAPEVDGDIDEWVGWQAIDAHAAGAVAVHGDTLYAAWRTDDPALLRNAGTQLPYLFKKGGALELMVRTARYTGEHSEPASAQAGDLRLLLTRVQDRTTAVLYRAVAPGAGAERRVVYESPIGKVTFDEVRDVSDQVRLAARDGCYEIAIPLKVLGLTAEKRREVLGDIGLLRGNGQECVQRAYWNNKHAQIVSDLPSEARLEPANWGLWRFDDPPKMLDEPDPEPE
jgi:hypothetical protein